MATPKEWLEEEKPEDHSKHLCSLLGGKIDVEEYKKLVRNPKFLCKKCGRLAANEGNLCEPMPL